MTQNTFQNGAAHLPYHQHRALLPSTKMGESCGDSRGAPRLLLWQAKRQTVSWYLPCDQEHTEELPTCCKQHGSRSCSTGHSCYWV